MRSLLILLALLCTPALGQVDIVAKPVFQVTGLENSEIVEGLVLSDTEPTLQLKKVARVIVTTEAANVEVSASNQSREPLNVCPIGKNNYIVEGTGKIWVDVSVWDFDKKIFVPKRSIVVELSPPEPPKPPVPPPPQPGSCDSKTDPVAKKVCQWVNETVQGPALAKRSELSKLYADTASTLYLAKYKTINEAGAAITKLKAELLGANAQAWGEWNNRVNNELSMIYNDPRIIDKRSVVVNFYNSVSEGLK